jgi:hypothetical protein
VRVLIRYLAMHEDLAEKALELWKPYITKKNWDVELVEPRDYAFIAQYMTCISPYDFVVQLDEDCFLFRPEAIHDMCLRMLEEKIAYAGMREKDCPLRKNTKGLTDYYINSFFMITQPGLIIPKMIDPEQILGWEKSGSTWLEPYWNIIGYLHSMGLKCHYIANRQHTDGISTILSDFNGKDFCIHTWFARLWDMPNLEDNEGVPGNKQRIEEALTWAKSR